MKVSGIKETCLELKKKLTEAIKQKEAQEKRKLLQELKDATPVDTGTARGGWHLTDAAIENDVPYLPRLNEGSSQQAPAHFIEQTIINHPHVIVTGNIVREK